MTYWQLGSVNSHFRQRNALEAAEKGRSGGFTPPSGVENNGYMAWQTRRSIPTNLSFSSLLRRDFFF
jgi:hypothetical protein